MVVKSVNEIQSPIHILLSDVEKLTTGGVRVVVTKVKLSTCVQSPKPPAGSCTVINAPATGAVKVKVRFTQTPFVGRGATYTGVPNVPAVVLTPISTAGDVVANVPKQPLSQYEMV